MMLFMMAAELAATGALAICWFQGLSAGKSDCPSSVGWARFSSSSKSGMKRLRDRRHGVRPRRFCIETTEKLLGRELSRPNDMRQCRNGDQQAGEWGYSARKASIER